MRSLILSLNGFACLVCLVMTVWCLQAAKGWGLIFGLFFYGLACLLASLICLLNMRRTPPGNVARGFILLVSLTMIGVGCYFAASFHSFHIGAQYLSLLGLLNIIIIHIPDKAATAICQAASSAKAICVMNALLLAAHCYFFIMIMQSGLTLPPPWLIMRGQVLPALAALACGYAAWTGRLQRLALVFAGIVLAFAMYGFAHDVYVGTVARYSPFTLMRVVFMNLLARTINFVYFFQCTKKRTAAAFCKEQS
jgi:hypothetical protein